MAKANGRKRQAVRTLPPAKSRSRHDGMLRVRLCRPTSARGFPRSSRPRSRRSETRRRSTHEMHESVPFFVTPRGRSGGRRGRSDDDGGKATPHVPSRGRSARADCRSGRGADRGGADQAHGRLTQTDAMAYLPAILTSSEVGTAYLVPSYPLTLLACDFGIERVFGGIKRCRCRNELLSVQRALKCWSTILQILHRIK